MNAVAVMRPNPDQVQTKRAVNLHPNILNKQFEVTGHVPKLMATWLTRLLKRETSKCVPQNNWLIFHMGEVSHGQIINRAMILFVVLTHVH